ncbi:NUDIX hydrolase [Xanthobacteraceae bacterium Astr-EGSB]|uniref:NUDIX domain-containing protein n=1 Tax=Astrobacterium formosum TaxID=3069710 RepID=UPI0027B1D38F|nr:NUDIX hydrolase [Xanthobacteraceae bacterium Astr-EGSB]
MQLQSILADEAADVAVSAPDLLADDSFRRFERYRVKLDAPDGGIIAQRREVLRVGPCVGVLALDRERGELVLIRQFRLAAHLSTGKGDLVEIVAGHVEAGEDPRAAAHRECIEEIGVAPSALYEMFSFMPAPGMLEEYATLYLGLVDAAQVPAMAGAADEHEQTRPIRVPVDAAIAALAHNTAQNGYLLLALQWLALQWPGLDGWIAERKPVWS